MIPIETAKRLKHVKEYYFSRKMKEVADLEKQGIKIINLGIGNPDLPPSRATIDALIQSAGKPQNHGYQNHSGIEELREAYAQWYQNFFDVRIDPGKELMPLMGSKEGIFNISLAFLNPGDNVLVPDPGYPSYRAAAEFCDAKTIPYNLSASNKWVPNWGEMEQLVEEHQPKIIWMNYPHMPTGTAGSTKIFKKFVEIALKHQIMLVNDNPYSFILNDDPQSIFSIKEAKSCTLELNTLSKSHNMAGWRMGMVTGHSAFIDVIRQVKSNIDSGMFLPVQEAAVKALESPKEWYDRINEIYHERRAYVFQLLNLLRCNYSTEQSGMFVWAQIPKFHESAEHFCDELLKEAGIFLAPGSIFGTNGKRYVRISLCQDKAIIHEAINRIYNIF